MHRTSTANAQATYGMFPPFTGIQITFMPFTGTQIIFLPSRADRYRPPPLGPLTGLLRGNVLGFGGSSPAWRLKEEWSLSDG